MFTQQFHKPGRLLLPSPISLGRELVHAAGAPLHQQLQQAGGAQVGKMLEPASHPSRYGAYGESCVCVQAGIMDTLPIQAYHPECKGTPACLTAAAQKHRQQARSLHHIPLAMGASLRLHILPAAEAEAAAALSLAAASVRAA